MCVDHECNGQKVLLFMDALLIAAAFDVLALLSTCCPSECPFWHCLGLIPWEADVYGQ
jgi:hypothetical protein